MKKTVLIFFIISLIDLISAYPFDGYKITGIRRLARLEMIINGELKGTMPPPGGRKSFSEIELNLNNSRGDSLAFLPLPNADLQKKIDAIFPSRDASYSLVLLDVSPGKKIRFAERKSSRQYIPGSVGKLAIAAGLFTELRNIYPNDPAKRQELLKTHMVTGGPWVLTDHHEVPFFDPETKQSFYRQIKESDVFSLYEWADHMLSASANSAASVVWKELILMRHFGKAYPPDAEQEQAFFKETSKQDLTALAMSVVNDPLREIGISKQDWNLGSFFTRYGKNNIPGEGAA